MAFRRDLAGGSNLRVILRKNYAKKDFLPWGWGRGALEVEWVRKWNGEGAPPPPTRQKILFWLIFAQTYPKIENRLSPTHALISTNFDAASSEMAPESFETAGNPNF